MSLSERNKTGGRSKNYLKHLRDTVIFAMFAALMFGSRVAMAALPNIHPLGLFIMLLTVVYRFRALIPIYIYVLLEGILAGFSPWWIPYLYIWTVLWGMTMLIPRSLPDKAAIFLYPVVCGLFGLLFGVLYAPAQALLFGLNFKQAVSWIVAGLPFDCIHACGNAVMGCLVLPLSKVLEKLNKS